MAPEGRWLRKLMIELNWMRSDPIPGITLSPNQEDDLTNWIIELRGAPGTIYDGELFKLQFEFNDAYPFKPPQVRFVRGFIPKNPHVYEDGSICISILSYEWSPLLNVRGVCLSILSLLSSRQEKVAHA